MHFNEPTNPQQELLIKDCKRNVNVFSSVLAEGRPPLEINFLSICLLVQSVGSYFSLSSLNVMTLSLLAQYDQSQSELFFYLLYSVRLKVYLVLFLKEAILYFTHCFLNLSTFHMDKPLFARPNDQSQSELIFSSPAAYDRKYFQSCLVLYPTPHQRLQRKCKCFISIVAVLSSSFFFFFLFLLANKRCKKSLSLVTWKLLSLVKGTCYSIPISYY